MFGISSNTVVDQSDCVMSPYGHLSSVDVSEVRGLARSNTLGRRGRSGLRPRDQRHFAIFLHGLPVNPVDWCDDHLIEDRLRLKLFKALKGYADTP